MEFTALQGVVMRVGTLADGTIRLTIDLTTDDLAQVAQLSPVHQTVAIAPITQPRPAYENIKQDPEPRRASRFGEVAKELRLSGFFRIQAVFEAIGKDSDFLAWLRLQPKSATGKKPHDGDPIEAAHVRRIADGAGTGIKPEYSAIPLLHSEHFHQHTSGESAIGNDDWWMKMRITYVEKWGWESLKHQLGYESWSELPPLALSSWAHEHHVQHLLPKSYKDIE